MTGRDPIRPALHAEVDGSGRGPRLVLVHGFTQTGRSWGRLAEDLARDHEVVRVDAPGHGGSSALHADLVEGAELLGRTGGPATYIGYSMGARLCLHLALGRPELVRTLVLIGATAGIADPDARAARRRDDEALAAELEAVGVAEFVARWLARPLFSGLTEDTAGRAARLENTVAGLASSLRLAGTGAQESLWGRLGQLTMPALLLAGEDDRAFAERATTMAAAMGPGATVALVPRAGHAAHLEAPDAVRDLVRPFLARTSGPA